MTFLVTTQVIVPAEKIGDMAALFDETNRDLVATHDDWLAATFSANRETGETEVLIEM